MGDRQNKIIKEFLYRVNIHNYMAENRLVGSQPDFDIIVSYPLYKLLTACYDDILVDPKNFRTICGHNFRVTTPEGEDEGYNYWFANKEEISI